MNNIYAHDKIRCADVCRSACRNIYSICALICCLLLAHSPIVIRSAARRQSYCSLLRCSPTAFMLYAPLLAHSLIRYDSARRQSAIMIPSAPILLLLMRLCSPALLCCMLSHIHAPLLYSPVPLLCYYCCCARRHLRSVAAVVAAMSPRRCL
jgi:hypothetical protein